MKVVENYKINGINVTGRLFVTRPLVNIDDWESGVLEVNGVLHPVINCRDGKGFVPSWLSDSTVKEIEEVKEFLTSSL